MSLLTLSSFFNAFIPKPTSVSDVTNIPTVKIILSEVSGFCSSIVLSLSGVVTSSLGSVGSTGSTGISSDGFSGRVV